MRTTTLLAFAFVTTTLFTAACHSDTVDSDEQARRAYLGLDPSIGESMTLGFAGFNAAQSANIPTEMSNGAEHGTLAITGQVDQGASANKGMRLLVGMVGWTDGPFSIDDKNDKLDITYDTSTTTSSQPALTLNLKGIPASGSSATGTLDGTLTGSYTMSGDLKGTVDLDLTITGTIIDDGTGKTVRKPGSTTVTGTAVDGNGMYMVSLTL
jgi:hypothetical protein